MTTFADELRESATNGAAENEIGHFKKLIKEKASKGFRETELAEFYYSENETLGTAKIDEERKVVVLGGPIERICAALQAEGVEIFFKQELRYKNHPKGSGVVTIAYARW